MHSEVKDHYEVVVVGAGPAGSVTAWEVAQLGLSVLLIEKRQEIGSPVRCAEGLTPGALDGVVAADPNWISARVRRAKITVVRDGRDYDWQPTEMFDREGVGGVGYIVERRVFDRVLAEKAAAAGAGVVLKTAVTGLLHEGDKVVGVETSGPGGRRQVGAEVVIGADGVESRVGVWAGLDTTLPLADLMSCAQFLLAGIDIDAECTYYYLDPRLAPGGYVWIFPKGEGRANVGLGIQADLMVEAPIELLTRFVEGRPFLAQGSPVTMVTGGVSVGLPPAQLVNSGCMLVGDAARQVDPLTGGGIANAMKAARMAARVAAEAIAAGDVAREALRRYEAAWQGSIGRRMERNYRLRARFPAGERSGERFLRVFAMSIGAGK
jgi:digeranylgeranylglycerophospholipid reductase